MKRFFLSLTLCSLLLVSGALFLAHFSSARERSGSAAREDLIAGLLKLPAPAPPNPLVSTRHRDRSEKFFDRKTPPPDDAPIEDLLDYWRHQNNGYRTNAYNPKPSEAALARMIPEIESEPDTVSRYLNVIAHSPAGIEMVKRIYDSMEDDGETEIAVYDGEYDESYSKKNQLKLWLTANSPLFAADLERKARQNGDVDGYVGNQDQFHALTKTDWERARPMVDRMYADGSQPASQALARWALYRNAMATGSAEVDRFRDELKAAVENKELSNAIRDLSLDALLMEKEWSGRDEWYFSLMSDETLVRLRPYTGLTTLMIHSPDDKYIDKMIELSKSENRVIRTAAVRNLQVRIETGGPEVVRALLPWLSDPAWVLEGTEGRENIVRKLAEVRIPESVPALISALDEKAAANTRFSAANVAANSAANAVDRAARDLEVAVANAANAVANAVRNSNSAGSTETYYPLRYFAIMALAKQADTRAAPALRRVLPKVEPYERFHVVQALLACNGYTVIEQADALESVAGQMTPVEEEDDDNHGVAVANTASVYSVSNANYFGNMYRPGPPDAAVITQILGTQILQAGEVSDGLVRELIGRIDAYEKTDPAMAEALRRMFINWKGPAVNALLLRDLKNDKSNIMAVLKLLGDRKELREKQPADVFDLRTGSPTAVGMSACLLESERDYSAVLTGKSNDAKAALFACGRLVRAPLPVKEVAPYLDSGDKLLAKAAELFLESEDSPEARSIVLSRHPTSAKIMGATTAFWPEDAAKGSNAAIIGILRFEPFLPAFAIDSPVSKRESEIREEVKNSGDLTGIYAYEDSSVRIYKDKVVLQWNEDESRYRERPLTRDEFQELTEYLETHKAADLPPFLDCRDYECQSRQLIMVGKSGGRRVFSLTERLPKFFAGLDSIFAGFRKTPGKLRYNLEKQVPGLEIIFSDDKFSAETVWKNGSDLRVLIADKAKRRAVDRELKEQAELLRDEATERYDSATEEKIRAARKEREYDEYGWFDIANGHLSAVTSQPAAAEYIPTRDSFSIRPNFGNWAAKTGALELRASHDGLYLISGGRMSKIAAGHYYNPVLTANGKWAIASKYSEEDPSKLVRINLTTKREFVVKSDENSPAQIAIAYVPALNKVLLTDQYYHDEGISDRELTAENTYWLDPDTGVLTPVKGEVRPLGHQKFRSLQPTGRLNEFWAAIPDQDKNTTSVGVYDSRTLSFKPVLVIPKIFFDSMDMWVDAAENKVYFVYSGHLLSLPLKQLPKQ